MVEEKYYDIILRDVKEAIESSKNKKPSGLDDIMRNEMLKCEEPNI